jgi:hypothetical protein
MVARWAGDHQYTIELILKEMIGRCRELSLRVSRPERQILTDLAILLAVQTMNYFYKGPRRMVM